MYSKSIYLVLCDLHWGSGLCRDLGPRVFQLGVVVELALDVYPAGRGVKLLKESKKEMENAVTVTASIVKYTHR